MRANCSVAAVLLVWISTVSRLPAAEGDTQQDSIEEIKAKAAAGDPESEFQLGLRYGLGRGVPKDYVKEVQWFRKAAEHNHANAQYFLGICYDSGEGVAKNVTEAVKWYRRAAEQDLAEAEFALGQAYASGEGARQDFVAAARWFRKAAEQGSDMAQYNLSACYFNGEGVPKDYVEAYKWRLLAAAQGFGWAQKYMSNLESSMTREQIAEGQKLARNFKPRRQAAASENSNSGDEESRPRASGSGFFITDDGHVITNEHVVRKAVQVRLYTSSGVIAAKVLKMDAANDLALLKAEGKFEALPVATSRTVRLGTTVTTIGFPNIMMQGFAPKFARGEIASLSGPRDDARYFQISVAVQPGNSGGALVDEHGNVIGVVSAKLSAKEALLRSGALPENVNYAVKSSFLLGFLESVPEIAAKLKEPNMKEARFADVVEQTKEAAVLVLAY